MVTLLKTYKDKSFFACTLQPISYLTLPKLELENFATLLISTDSSIGSDVQSRISRWLVDAGTRYVLSAGYNCSSWDDSIDFANLDKYNFEDIPEDSFIMTTWHDDESVDDVLFQLLNITTFDNFCPENFLLLQVGPGNQINEYVHRLEEYFGGLSFA